MGKTPCYFPCKNVSAQNFPQQVKIIYFAHGFLDIIYNHISWESDSTSIHIDHMKTDTEGGDSSRKQCIYENPYCIPIFSQADVVKYLAYFNIKGTVILFDLKSYTRFQKHLKELVTEHQDEFEIPGVMIDNIGVHSVRKLESTYFFMVNTSAQHINSVCNRSGLTMVNVKDT